ncbi:hypothetical protein GCM10009837_45560 [Streptomyces durmitorensis]
MAVSAADAAMPLRRTRLRLIEELQMSEGTSPPRTRKRVLATQSGLMAEANYRLGVPLRRVLGIGVPGS